MAEKTHKILFLNPETLMIDDQLAVAPPFILGIDEVQFADGVMRGINKPYIIVESSYSGMITSNMLTDFQREIAYKLLEQGYSKQQGLLMGGSSSYDEYMQKEIDLKRRYFNVKQQIPLTAAPFLLNLELVN